MNPRSQINKEMPQCLHLDMKGIQTKNYGITIPKQALMM